MSISFAKEIHPTSPAHKIGFVGVLLPSVALIAAFIFSMPSASQHFALLAASKKITTDTTQYTCTPNPLIVNAIVQDAEPKAKDATAVLVGAASPEKDTALLRQKLSDRKSAVLSLLQNNPRAVLPLLMTEELTKKLSWSKNCVESYTTLTGTVIRLAVDPEKPTDFPSTEYYQLTTNTGAQYVLHFANDLHAVIKNGDTIDVRGYAFDAHLLVDGSADLSVLSKAPIITGQTGYAVKNTREGEGPVLGPQETIVLLANFANTSQPSLNQATVNQRIFTDMNAYFSDNSYNKISVVGQVQNWRTVSLNQSCDFNAMLNAAIPAFDADVDFSQFERIVVISPFGPSCTWGGISTIGKVPITSGDGTSYASASFAVANYAGVSLLGHEFGHGLGLGHANFYNCPNVPFQTSGCSETEYGDPASIMGNHLFMGYFNALEKDYFGWFSPSNILTVSQSGTYTIDHLEVASTTRKVLKIPRDENEYLYAEYRQPIGHDSNLGTTNAYEGALLHIGAFTGLGSPHANQSFLLDGAHGAGWGSANDAALTVGQTFTDPFTNTAITTVAKGDGDLNVNVQIGKHDFIRPEVSITSPTPGSDVTGTFTVTVDAQDASGIEKVELRNAASPLKSLIGTDTTAPYEFTVDSTMFPQGGAVIVATAYDLAGSPYGVGNNSGASDFFSFNVMSGDTTPPTIAISTPANNTAVKNNVFVEAQADDNGFMSRLELFVDGVKKYFIFGDASVISGTLTLTQGQHTAYAIAYDSAGLSTQSATSTFVVDDTVPVVSLLDPQEGAQLSGIVTISANASDNDQIAKVEFYLDGTTKVGEDTSSPYAFGWDSSLTSLGAHTVSAKALDRAGNTVTSAGRGITILAPQVFVCGDADGSTMVNISDAVLLINYIFQGGRNPVPLASGDANGDGLISISDAVYLINYVFNGGPAPVCPSNRNTVKNSDNPALGYTLDTFKAAYPSIFKQ